MAADLRPLRADETALLAQATLGNLNWCGERFTADDVAVRPEFAHYVRLVPERGDLGVVAEAGPPIGVAWAQFLPEDDPGYGFVDAATPEVSLWVAAAHRRRGIGRTLLRALLAAAAERGVPRVSLSVEGDNPARRLYEAEGFTSVPGREADGVMICELPG